MCSFKTLNCVRRSAGLKGYKYAGSDHSLVLKYITNPIYNKIVTYIPLWVAPNLITLSGLGCSWVASLLSRCLSCATLTSGALAD